METDENSSICLEIPHNTQHTLNQIENLMHILEKKRQSCISNSIQTTNILTLDFLDRLKKEKSHELKLLQEEVRMIERDITTVNTMLSETEKTAKNFKFEKNLKDKRSIINGRFEEIEKNYEQNCLGKRVSGKLVVSEGENPHKHDDSSTEKTGIDLGLDGFRDNLHKTVRYTKLECLAQFQFNPHVVQSTNIVSSIDFDRNQEYFAVGGILKKIKIYDFENIVEAANTTGLGVLEHQPCYEMKTPDKISALNFSWYHKQKLAASLYDGQVQVLDASTGQIINSLREHSERCWSIDFNPHNPMHLASGADDGLVKIWDLEDRSEKSVGRIYLGQNVCAVQWSPGNQYQLAIGTVDHLIKLYDIRKTRQPLCTFSGHSKAVSYVKFLDSKSMISLSTDSTIKQWDTGEADMGSFAHVPNGLKSVPVKSYKGHRNTKNFVGLTCEAPGTDYFACGSEDNNVYVYYRNSEKPIAKHGFGDRIPTKIRGLGNLNDSSGSMNDIVREYGQDIEINPDGHLDRYHAQSAAQNPAPGQNLAAAFAQTTSRNSTNNSESENPQNSFSDSRDRRSSINFTTNLQTNQNSQNSVSSHQGAHTQANSTLRDSQTTLSSHNSQANNLTSNTSVNQNNSSGNLPFNSTINSISTSPLINETAGNIVANATASAQQHLISHHRNILPPRGMHPASLSNSQAVSGNDFISAVCWKKNSGVIAAANSQGMVKLLRLV
jgi:E3 ubiquitin-protein ligase RFWD2